jgi:hypothetical protein
MAEPLYERLEGAADMVRAQCTLGGGEALADLLDEAADALEPKDALPWLPLLLILFGAAAHAVFLFLIQGAL